VFSDLIVAVSSETVPHSHAATDLVKLRSEPVLAIECYRIVELWSQSRQGAFKLCQKAQQIGLFGVGSCLVYLSFVGTGAYRIKPPCVENFDYRSEFKFNPTKNIIRLLGHGPPTVPSPAP
jgi:hypothetical protein